MDFNIVKTFALALFYIFAGGVTLWSLRKGSIVTKTPRTRKIIYIGCVGFVTVGIEMIPLSIILAVATDNPPSMLQYLPSFFLIVLIVAIVIAWKRYRD